MTLLDALGFATRPPNAAQRALQRLASSRPGSWVFSRTLHPVDRWLLARTDGRTTLPGILAGMPVVMLSTTGAKTGRERRMPVLGIPISGNLAVIGSNFGQVSTPGWVYNLEADPRATVEYRGATVDVTARAADDAEEREIFGAARPIYGGFDLYVERAAHRRIRVFVLEPTGRGEAPA